MSKICSQTCPHCRKGIYPTMSAALTQAITRLDNGADPLRAYRCPRGFGFHLTSQPPKVKKKKARNRR